VFACGFNLRGERTNGKQQCSAFAALLGGFHRSERCAASTVASRQHFRIDRDGRTQQKQRRFRLVQKRRCHLHQVVPDGPPPLSDGSGLLHNGKGATSGAGLGAAGGIIVRAGLDFLALRLTVFLAAFLAAFFAFFFTAFFGAERLAAAFLAVLRPAALAFFFFGAFFAAFLAVFFAAFFTDLAAFFLELLAFDLSAFLALAIVVLLLPT
jgi:hypothetical protein